MFPRYVRRRLTIEKLLSQNGTILGTVRQAIARRLRVVLVKYARYSTSFARSVFRESFGNAARDMISSQVYNSSSARRHNVGISVHLKMSSSGKEMNMIILWEKMRQITE